MIQFNRDGTKVKIIIKGGVIDYSFNFYHECTSDYMAELMKESYRKKLNHELEKIRKQSYEDGWKDAKAKRAKRTWFKPWWE